MDDELSEWLRHVCSVLELPADVPDHQQVLLDVARDVAHNVMRPAAPLSTFLVGLAAGRSGADIDEVATVVSALATEWQNRPAR